MTQKQNAGVVLGVQSSPHHSFSKPPADAIELLAGLGVAGDAHAGKTVQHLSRVARDPSQPNLRQVHLIHSELLDELARGGHDVAPGGLGENITTRGIDLLVLPRGARLHLGPSAVIEITGLRNPCAQIDTFQPGLLTKVLARDAQGGLIRKSGVMAVVLEPGMVRKGDVITLTLPAQPHVALAPV